MSDVIVIGGGIIGLLAARNLSISGAGVTVFDQGACFAESSLAGAGIVSTMRPWAYPDEVNRLIFRSRVLYPSLVDILFEETGIDGEYFCSGMLLCDEEREEVGAARQWAKKHSFELQVQTAESGEGRANLLFPEVASLNNPLFGKALRASFEADLDVQLYEHQPVISIEFEKGKPVCVCGDRDFVADQVLVCAGAWSGALLADSGLLSGDSDLGRKAGTFPIKGQILQYRLAPGEVPHILLKEGRYIVPRRDGALLVGSTGEDVGFDKQLTRDALEALGDFAKSMLPQLEGKEPEAHWAGLRPATTTELPFSGRLPDMENIYVCTGHFRNGLAMAPAAAEEICREMSGS
jgi:glycine oxidase